jgi:alkanesulfonate monooxygenase SsuD/methylene tetrahydromethanopterin reductase-like flavin-dependent oxidoreductase (luciferase family)
VTDTFYTPPSVHPWVTEGIGRLRFGISVFRQPPDWQEFVRLVQRIEELGFDSYLAYDHPIDWADCWTSLSALAMATSRIRLGTIVDCIYYRNPYLLARMAADVDRISGGRVVVGLGIGDKTEEFAQMGIPFPPTAERLRCMEETLQILIRLWRGETFDYDGEFFTLRCAHLEVGPIQERMPILLAGGGEKVTLRQVAQYADASNFGSHAWIGSAFTPTDFRRKYDILAGYLEQFGRRRDDVVRSHFAMPLVIRPDRASLDATLRAMPQDTLEWCGPALFAGTSEEAIAFYRDLAAIGCQYFVANILTGDWETIELLGTAVMPTLQEV